MIFAGQDRGISDSRLGQQLSQNDCVVITFRLSCPLDQHCIIFTRGCVHAVADSDSNSCRADTYPDTAVIATVRLDPLPPNKMLPLGTAVVLEELPLSVSGLPLESATVRFIVPPELEHIPPTATEIVGATVSIVQVKEAGVGSTLPTPSIARTWKVWLPSARLL